MVANNDDFGLNHVRHSSITSQLSGKKIHQSRILLKMQCSYVVRKGFVSDMELTVDKTARDV
ncbi:hypothetical protein DICVIV_12444 [Dictyocaulus viviparus]|uniref:Uncharacterized protein n=1 Tax=Dictyocaulus viviparus TaxID=29172 RepID=A0A0D8XAF6_DICVI|nr:hypothetical protein DICVIV_12444 [Dictyocaulus viviparus]